MIPYGYQIKEGKVLIEEKEQEKLLNLFQNYVSGEKLCVCIKRSGIDKTTKTCKRMLKDERYIGTDFYPALISDDLFFQTQKELQDREIGCKKISRRKREEVPVSICFEIVEENDISSFCDPEAYAAFQYSLIKAIQMKGEEDER